MVLLNDEARHLMAGGVSMQQLLGVRSAGASAGPELTPIGCPEGAGHTGVQVGSWLLDLAPRGQSGRWIEIVADDQRTSLISTWEPDEAFPYPQANDVDKVACVVDIGHEGTGTPAAVAIAFGMSAREGAH